MKNLSIAAIATIIAVGTMACGDGEETAPTVSPVPTIDHQLQRDNDRLAGEVARLKTEQQALADENADLRAKNGVLSAENADLRAEVAALAARPTPTPTPAPPSLSASMESASLWVYLRDGRSGVEASGLAYFDLEPFQIDLHVAAGASAAQYCQPDTVFSGITFNFGCSPIEARHSQVDRVAASAGRTRLDCAKQDDSTDIVSVWACLVRE